MPVQACRTVLRPVIRDHAAHAGLVLSRYLQVPVKDSEAHPAERLSLFNAAITACRNAQLLYGLAYRRWKADIEHAAHAIFEALVRGRLIVGLGSENVLETGLTLHHIYGTPLIPGSALKGLTAHYCARAWGRKDSRFQPEGEYYRALFGATDDSGHIVFHDAWITPQSLTDSASGLVRDVMTPHHADYYMDKLAERAPTDSDMPTPVPFLAVTGTFLIAVSSDISDPALAREWSSLALTLTREALQYWGIGGKTNAGYGRMGSAPQSAASGVAAEGNRPKFKVGERVLVERVPDPKGRDRVWFRAEDGFCGMVRPNETPPDVEIGKTAQLFISSVTGGPDRGYIFSAQPNIAKPLPQKRPDKKR